MKKPRPLIAQSGVGFKKVNPDAHKTYKSGGTMSKKNKCGKKSK